MFMIDFFSSQEIFLECRNKKIKKQKTEDWRKNLKSSAENGRVGSYADVSYSDNVQFASHLLVVVFISIINPSKILTNSIHVA